MSKIGKKHEEALKLIDPAKAYSVNEAISNAKKAAHAKFDETVELHLRMGVDPRASNQMVRGVAVLPNGLGKKMRVLVFTQGEGVRIAQEAGADYVGADDLVKKIEAGWTDFDVAIATPDTMGKLGKLGKTLGRRGLMPNPKSGTVVPPPDLPRAIGDARKGRAEFKLDKTAGIHMPVGKIGFDEDKLAENVDTALEAIARAKPSGSKGQYIRTAYLSTTMGPGFKLDIKPILALGGS
ncbi:MAG: 50S ribosomal protein L1 [Dehalococcoidia bacterium]|nr:50S ribosomal protein L1 [Dehalococcoidia bacterium]